MAGAFGLGVARVHRSATLRLAGAGAGWLAHPVASKVNQCTLLVATLPLVFSAGSGAASALPLDARQSQEVFLTAAQSLFATLLVIESSLTRGEAAALFVLFIVQLALPSVEVRWATAAAYLLLVVLLIAFSPHSRRALPRLPSAARSLPTRGTPPGDAEG